MATSRRQFAGPRPAGPTSKQGRSRGDTAKSSVASGPQTSDSGDLQTLMGNRSIGRLLQRRPAPATAIKDGAAILDGELGAFDTYARQRADWSNDSSIAAHDHDLLRILLAWARATPGALAALGSLKVRDLIAGDFPEMRRKVLAVYSDQDLIAFRIPEASLDLPGAEKIGTDLAVLTAAIKPAQLKRLLVDKPRFDALRPHFARFAEYFTRAAPTMDSDNGADVDGYLGMVNEDSVYPNTFVGTVPNLRNVHRFRADVIRGFQRNMAAAASAGKTPTRPLRLVLYSTFDHNGAYTRDEHLIEAVNDPTHITLILEGEASLSAMGGHVQEYAAAYGQGGKVHEVLMVGHGESRILEMAGKTTDGGEQAGGKDRTIDLAEKETDDFLHTVVGSMTPGQSRIVIKACLTASNGVPGDVNPKPGADAHAEVRAALAKNPSIASRLSQIAAETRPGDKVDVRGAIASVYPMTVGVMDPSGKGGLGLYTPAGDLSDPDVGNTDHSKYITTGLETTGCLRAVVETAAQLPAGPGMPTGDQLAIQAMKDRVAHPRADSWGETVILTCYKILLDGAGTGSLDMAQLLTLSRTGEAMGEGNADPYHAWSFFARGLDETNYRRLMTALGARGEFAGLLKCAALIPWAAHDDTKRADLFTALGATTAAEAHDPIRIDQSYGPLFPIGPVTAPTRGQLVLAIAGAMDANPGSLDFLDRWVPKGPAADIPDPAAAETASGGLLTNNDILVAIGRRHDSKSPSSKASPADPTNLKLAGGGGVHVEPAVLNAITTPRGLNVRSRPEFGDNVVKAVPAGTELVVMGEVGKWFAVEIEVRGKRMNGFVFRTLTEAKAPA